MLPRLNRGTLLLLLATIGLGCGADDSMGPPQVPLRVILPDQWRVVRGFSSLLTPIEVIDTSGKLIRNPDLAYSSSDPALLTVSRDGTVRSVGGLGTAMVIAEIGGVSDTVVVGIVERIGSLTIEPDSLVLNRTRYADLEIHLTDKNGIPTSTDYIGTFTSSNRSIATVDGAGRVTAMNASGSVTINLSVDTFSVNIPVRVTQFPKSITFDPAEVRLQNGGSQTISVTLRDSVDSLIKNPTLSFTSEAPSLFSVSSGGRITAVAASGSGTVRVSYGDLVGSVGVLIGSSPAFNTLHKTTVLGNVYEAEAGPGGQVVVTVVDQVEALRGTLPAFTFGDTFNTTGHPLGVAINHAGTRAYVAASEALRVLDLTSNSVLPPILTPESSTLAVVVTANDQTAYVSTDAYLFRVNLVAGTVTDSLLLPGAVFLALDPVHPMLYATTDNSSLITGVNLNTFAVSRTLASHGSPKEIAISPDGNELYLADENGNLLVFDLADGELVQRVPTGSNAYGLSASADLIAVATFTGIEIFDRVSRVRLAQHDLGGLPRRPAISADQGTIIVPNEGGWVDFIQH